MNDYTNIDFKNEYQRLIELPLIVVSIIHFIFLILFRDWVKEFLNANNEFPFIIGLFVSFFGWVTLIYVVGKKLVISYCLKKQYSKQQLDKYNRIAKIVHAIAMVAMTSWLLVVSFSR